MAGKMADINSDDFRQLLEQIRAQSSILEGIFKNTGGKGPASNPDLASANKALRELGKNLRDDNDKLKENNKENTLATRSLKALGAGAKEVGGVLSSMARNSTEVSSNLNTLKPAVRAVATGASAAAKSFGSAAESVGAAASAFPHIFARVGGLLVSGAGTMLKTLGSELAARAGDAVTWYIDQLQDMTGHYNSLSQSGGLAADGLTGMALKANKMSTSLGALSQLSAQFGGDLAMVYGTVERGLTQVAKAAEAMGPETRERFLAMGVTLEEQNEAIAAYSRVHLWNARQERLTFTELSKAAQTYVTESDAFSKLLGISRREMQDRMAAQHALVRWGAVLETMPETTQSAVKGFMEVMQKQAGPEVVAGMQEMFSGVISSDAGRKLVTVMGSQALEITRGIREGVIDPLKGGEMLRQLLVERSGQLNLKGMESLIGGLTPFDGLMVETRRLTGVMTKNQESLPELVAAALKAQEVQDDAAKNLASSQVAMAKTTQELNKMFIETLPVATKVLDAASNTMAGAVTDFKGVIDDVLAHFGKSKVTTPPAPVGPPLSRMLPGPPPGPAGKDPLLDLVGREGGVHGYNALVYGQEGRDVPRSADLTKLTIAQVQQYQKGMVGRGHASSAVGKYQVVGSTLDMAVKALKLDPGTQFTPEVQDKIGTYLIEMRRKKAKTNEEFAKQLQMEWAGLAGKSGKSHYEGVAGNKSFISHNETMDAIMKSGRGFKTGGISTGPNAGYMQLLHGTEAVVPLPDGNSIPISVAGPAGTGLGSIGLPRVEIAASSAAINVQIPEIREMNTRMTEQMTAMQMQLSKLSEMIDILRRGVQVNEKILQATRN